MKKMLSLLLTLLVLALPLLGGAETAFSSLPAVQTDFAAKYMAEGQEKITTVSFVPGALLSPMLGEETGAMITDLLSVLSLQAKEQTFDNKVQAGFSVLLNGEEAVWLTGALSGEGIFAASNLLGEDLYMVTPDQLATLMDQAVQSLVAQGKITQEQVDSVKAWFETFQKDPQAALLQLVGEVDLTGVQAALTPILSSMTTEEVTEAPEKLPDAQSVVVIPLKKADLTALADEIAKVLWSMPVVQKLAPSVTLSSGEKLTEESLTAVLRKFPDALAEDAELRIYNNSTNEKIYVSLPMKLNAGGDTVDSAFDLLMAVEGDDVSVEWTMNAAQDGEIVLAAGNMAVTGNHLDYTVTTDVTPKDGQTWRPMEEIISMDFASDETSVTVSGTVTARIKSDPESSAIGLVFTLSGAGQDKGDHAEDAASVVIGLEGMGDLLTIQVNEITAQPEAWITDASAAVQPMAMSAEEQQALLEKIQNNLQTVIMSVVQKLPQSVLQTLAPMMQ